MAEKKTVKRKVKNPNAVKKAVAGTVTAALVGAKGDEAAFDFGRVISTGSTLLDLAISGKRIRGGGIPGGILVSIQGASSAGKSALLAEMAASVDIRGGSNRFLDTEGRLDKQFAAVFGMSIPDEDILMTDTVEEMFEDFSSWAPSTPQSINLYSVDSISSLCSKLEMTDDGDKMGMKKPKILSEGFRKIARVIPEKDLIIACTNQLRQTTTGKDVISGGNAQGYHSSLTMSMKPRFAGGAKWMVKKKHKIPIIDKQTGEHKEDAKGNPQYKTMEMEKQIGGYTDVSIIKSSIDDPFRKCTIYIRYDRGIDDVSANLQYMKDMTKATSYNVYDKTISIREKAAQYIEDNDLEERLREDVIDMWEATEALFKSTRKIKKRR